MDRSNEAVLETAGRMLSDGYAVENILALLREHGLSKTASIKALMDLQGLTLAEAKRVVHLSPTWQDVYKRDEALHDVLAEAVEQVLRHA